MATTDTKASPEFQALVTLLRETLLRAAADEAYVLNPKEPGFVDTCRSLSAATASRAPGEGRKPICAHANHVLYGIELATRTLSGEQGVYESADWNEAWKLETVSDEDWHALVERLERQAKLLMELVPQQRDWQRIALTGTFGIPAHTAYHLGAARQMLLDLGAK
jgi:hypothetical protein